MPEEHSRESRWTKDPLFPLWSAGLPVGLTWELVSNGGRPQTC